MLNVCSGSTVQPAAVSRSTTEPTSAECASSSSFAISAPRHREFRVTETPRIVATRRTVRTEVSSTRPRSISDTIGRLTPAAEASCSWVIDRRSLTALIEAPN
jgi:hypothetical protein